MANLIRQLGKNVFSSWASLGVRVLIVFLVNPFIIHTLGNDRYGAWMLVISIVNYMTILDLGLKQSLIKFVSKYLGLKDHKKVNAIIQTLFTLYSFIALAVIIITLMLSFFSLRFFNIPSELLFQVQITLIIIGISTAINFFFASLTESLGAMHRYDIYYAIAIGEDLLRVTSIIIILNEGWGLVPFAMAYLVFNLMKNLLAVGLLKKAYKKLEFRPFKLDRSVINELKRYSLAGFFILVAWLMIVNTDNLLVGYFFDAGSITFYSIAAGFIMYMRTLIVAISFPVRPLISHYDAQKRRDNIRFIYTAGTKYLLSISLIIAGITLIFADSFILLWMGEDYELTAQILKILIVPAAICIPQAIANSVFFGIGKLKPLFYIILGEGTAHVILSIILLKIYGIPGVAWGAALPQFIIYLFIVPAVVKTAIGFNLKAYYFSLIRYAAPLLVVAYGISYLYRQLFAMQTWITFGIGIMTAIIVSLASAYLLADKDELKSMANKFKNK